MTQPWGSPPDRRSPWGQRPAGNPYGQSPWGQNPYGQNPYARNLYGSAPARGQRGFGQNPYGVPPGSPFGRRPPRRRRHPFRTLVLAALAVGLFMMFSTTLSNLTASSPSSSSDPAGPYQNEDYQVPPPDTTPPAIPQPETYEEAETLLTQNPFYDQVAPDPVRCTS